MDEQDLYMLIPPSGPFWGVMRQSGLIIASQIQERETAELLVVVLNIIDGDFDTVGAISKEFRSLWDANPDPGAEDYLVRQFSTALANYVNDKIQTSKGDSHNGSETRQARSSSRKSTNA